jgi:hypothetical protein
MRHRVRTSNLLKRSEGAFWSFCIRRPNTVGKKALKWGPALATKLSSSANASPSVAYE